MQGLIIWISTFISACTVVVASQQYVTERGEFVEPRDQQIVDFQLENFSKECTFVSSFEDKLMSRFTGVYSQIDKKEQPTVAACYDESLPKMRSVRFLYDKLCSSLTAGARKRTKNQYFSQFVSVHQYQDGISLLHIILNDCLKSAGAKREQIVASSTTAAASTGLIEGLKKIDAELPFIPNNREIR